LKEHSFSDAQSIAREILSYLHDHPDAQDTIEGIMQWWLLEKKVPVQEQSFQAVLTDLVKKGLLNKVMKQARVFYKLNP
jgi:predicted transcriptional regulator